MIDWKCSECGETGTLKFIVSLDARKVVVTCHCDNCTKDFKIITDTKFENVYECVK